MPLRAMVAVTAAACVALPGRAAAQQPVDARAAAPIPIQLEDARAYVPVRVTLGARGAAERWFIFDTGAQPTLLDAALADSMGVQVTSAGVTTGAGRGSTRVGNAGPLTLDLSGIPLGPITARVAPLDSLLGATSGREIPGVVGSRFFREHVVELDFDSLVMHASDPRTFDPPRDAVAVPLDVEGDIPYARGWLTTPEGRRIPMRLLVDLGAKSTLLLTEPFVRAQRLESAFSKRVENPLGAGMGGPTRYAFARAPALEIATSSVPLRLAEALVGLSVGGTLRSAQYDALLGADFLARYRVTFDYARRVMYLRPRLRMLPRAELDMSGMYLMSDRAARRIIVHEVRPQSPAHAAGVRPGDVLVSLDGRPVREMSLAAVRGVLRSQDGRVVRLVLARGGVTRDVTLTLRRVI